MAEAAAKPSAPGINLAELLGTELLCKKDGVSTSGSLSGLDGKYVGLYFSAHWCPPCRSFTPVLKQVHRILQSQGKPFEVVFISSDQSKREFEEYYDEMPWMAVPFGAETRRRGAGNRFGVSGIPTLVILSPDGQVVNRNARSAVIGDREGARFPWAGEEEPRDGNWRTIMFLMLLAWFVVRLFWK